MKSQHERINDLEKQIDWLVKLHMPADDDPRYECDCVDCKCTPTKETK